MLLLEHDYIGNKNMSERNKFKIIYFAIIRIIRLDFWGNSFTVYSGVNSKIFMRT